MSALQRWPLRVALWSLSAVGSSACGPLDSDASDFVSSPILAGQPAPEAISVVGVVNFAGGQCSGSLILPNLVLTARHCIAGSEDDTTAVMCDRTTLDTADSAGAVFVVPLAQISDDPADYHAVSRIQTPEGASSLCGSDVALLHLSQALALPALTPRIDSPVVVDEPYSAVGYGVDGRVGPGGVRRRLDELSVVCAGAECPASTVFENEWVGSGGVCSGDSGGPALDAEGRVIGVVSRGKDDCRSPIYAHVFSYADWLRSAAESASESAGYELPNWARGFSSEPRFNWPVGAACTANTDCESNTCAGDSTCTRACAAEGPCPTGYQCEAEAGLCRRDQPTLASSCALRAPAGGNLWAHGLAGLALLAGARLRRRK